jgi:hypothetical protein
MRMSPVGIPAGDLVLAGAAVVALVVGVEPDPPAKGSGAGPPTGAGYVIGPAGAGCTGTNRTDPSGCGTFQPMSRRATGCFAGAGAARTTGGACTGGACGGASAPTAHPAAKNVNTPNPTARTPRITAGQSTRQVPNSEASISS